MTATAPGSVTPTPASSRSCWCSPRSSDKDPFGDAPIATLSPFAHIGIELPTKEAVDEIAAKGEAAGCLGMPARQMPDPIGYICMLRDPDGNNLEFSYDQGVYEKVREVWG